MSISERETVKMDAVNEGKIKLWVDIDRGLKETNLDYSDKFVNTAMEVVHMKIAHMTEQLEEIAQFRTKAICDELLKTEDREIGEHVEASTAGSRETHEGRASSAVLITHPHIQEEDFQLWRRLK